MRSLLMKNEERIFFKGYCLILDGRIEAANGMAVDVNKNVKVFVNNADFDAGRLEECAQHYLQRNDVLVGEADDFIKNSKFFNLTRNEMAVPYHKVKVIDSEYNHTCVKCGAKVNEKVHSFCESKGWETLCFSCQPNRKRKRI